MFSTENVFGLFSDRNKSFVNTHHVAVGAVLFGSWQRSEAGVAAGCLELAATLSVELQQSRNACSGRRARLHEGRFGRGPCCASEKACMLGYISRGFVTIVMKRPGSRSP